MNEAHRARSNWECSDLPERRHVGSPGQGMNKNRQPVKQSFSLLGLTEIPGISHTQQLLIHMENILLRGREGTSSFCKLEKIKTLP